MKPVKMTMALNRIHKVHRDSEVLANLEVMNALRAAGVPIIGAISVRGVEHGQLTLETDRLFGEVTYTWTPDPDYEEDPAAGL